MRFRISVVIPAYNEEEFLARCLESFRSQSRKADEIIVVDNNSTDGTAEVAKFHGAKVIRETKQGIMPAACSGFDACEGDIIARCDADSILPVDWLERIEKSFQSLTEVGGVTGPGKFYGGNQLQARLAKVWYMYAYFLLAGSALANWPLFGSNFAIRRSLWLEIREKVHRNRADIHDDMDISMHISPTKRIYFMRKLAVGVSARSLRASDMRRRLKAGWVSLSLHWPEQAPWRRWKYKIMKKPKSFK